MNCSEETVVEAMIQTALATPSQVVIIPAQDVLGLGGEARMNIPGVGEGNWSWRMKVQRVRALAAKRFGLG